MSSNEDGGAATVRSVRDVGPDAVAIEIDTPADFSARPGQFVKLTAPGLGESRFYSLSSPDDEETIEVTVAVDPDGTLGPWLAEREPGDELLLAGPFGDTYYDGEARAVILAGGPGVGPAVGIAERALADGNDAAIVYRDDAPMHEQRLSALASLGASVAVVRDDDAFGPAVTAALRDGDALFVYGFAAFLDAATDAIEAAGHDADAAHLENFG